MTQQANLAKGAARLEELVKRHRPAHGEFYLQLGNAWRNLGRSEKAMFWLEEAVKRMPGNWRPLALLAASIAEAGDKDRAVETLVRAAAMSPRETACWMQLGEIEMSRGRWREAIAAFQTAINIVPELAEAHNRLWPAFMSAGEGHLAEASLREAVRLRPEYVPARSNLASLLALKDEFPEARRHFEFALRLDPEYVEARAAYATALAQKGFSAEAKPQYEQALRLRPRDAVLHQNLATVLAQLGDSRAALREYQAAIRIEPQYFEAHLAIGAYYLSINRKATARSHLLTAARSTDVDVAREARERLAELGR